MYYPITWYIITAVIARSITIYEFASVKKYEYKHMWLYSTNFHNSMSRPCHWAPSHKEVILLRYIVVLTLPFIKVFGQNI